MVSAQMGAPHTAGVVAVRKAALDEFAAPAQKPLAIGSLQSPPIGVDRPALPFLARPIWGLTHSWLEVFFLRLRSSRASSSRVDVLIPDSRPSPFRNSS